jgi:hypothetical protein
LFWNNHLGKPIPSVTARAAKFGGSLSMTRRINRAISPDSMESPSVRKIGAKPASRALAGQGVKQLDMDIKLMNKDTFRVVTRGADGQIRIRDYDSQEALLKRHSQVGVDDCSTDLGLRGQPVFRGLIGPMPEGQNVVRYESPEVFETLTKDWSLAKPTRRRSRRTTPTL